MTISAHPDAPDASQAGWLRRLRHLRPIARAITALGWIDTPSRQHTPIPPAATTGPMAVLAAKIVFSHARNRQQLLGPPPTALGQLDNERTELLMQTAILAARVSGAFNEAAERRVRGVLSSVGLQSTDLGFLQRALDHPAPLDELLYHVRDAHLVSLVYAAALLGADRHNDAAQAWLRYLALRLNIPAETLARLHSQFGGVG